ncbi:MAG: hypothetical protein ABSE93_22580, partial [Terriglobia bacterium]
MMHNDIRRKDDPSSLLPPPPGEIAVFRSRYLEGVRAEPSQRTEADRRLARSGLFDTIVVTSRRSLRGFGRADNRNGAPPAESRPLDEKARAEMARLPN